MANELAKIQSPAPAAPAQPETAPPIVAPTPTTTAQSAVPSPQTAQPSQPPQQAAAPRLSTIRTFRADLDAAIKGENISMATVAIKEAERRRNQSAEIAPQGRTSTRNILIASIGLVGLGLAALGIGFLYFQSTAPAEVIVESRVPLIFADSTSYFDTSEARPSDIIEAVQRKLRTIDRQIGTIEEVVFTAKREELAEEGTTLVDTPISSGDFVRSLGTAAPEGLPRALTGEFMYGVHAWQQNHGFMLFKVTSYERAYQELLSWERRFLARDILPLLEENTGPREGISEKQFRDAIIRNIDTRVLRDDAGKPILIYGFLNNENLVIAGSQETFIEVLSRFTTPRPVVR